MPEQQISFPRTIDTGQTAEILEPADGHTEAAKAGMPQLDPSSFASQLFWLAITFAAMYLLMARSVLPRIHEVLEKRRFRISQDLERAEALSREADEARNEYTVLHTKSLASVAAQMDAAKAAARVAYDARMAEMDKELAQRMQEAQAKISAKREDVAAEMRPAVAEVVTALVKAVAGAEPAAAQVEEAVSQAEKS